MSKYKKVTKIDEEVIKGFGDEWSRFDQSEVDEVELKNIFNSYFFIFPWNKLSEDSVGFDLGCGSGRWANFVAPRVGLLHCIEPSSAIEIAKRNLLKHKNIKYHKNDVSNIPLDDESMDFGYSLGVLHHISQTEEGLRNCVLKLKKGSPFLIYLYYSFENRSTTFKTIWKISDYVRKVISKLPMPIRYFISQIIAFLVYLPMSITCRILTSFGFSTDHMPLSAYKDKSLYTMRTDALDRFGTKIEKRFSKKEIEKMMYNAGLGLVKFHDGEPYWCVVGIRKN
ncbi:class I SAM-dependent methyltransferase [Alphaproteobacteria bacterium]|nr:class I SAM-dependent methyltransferase [Alphaproteobacteria bacterium]